LRRLVLVKSCQENAEFANGNAPLALLCFYHATV
jgi:hypothetical protein